MAFKNLVILLLSRFLRSRLSSFLCRVAFRKPAFVITTNPGAFLGNQLTIYAHVIACAQECGREVWGPSFFMYAKHFESSSRDLFTRWPTRRSFLYPLQSLRVFLYYYVFARVVRVILLHPEPPVKDVTVITDYERKQSLESPEFLRETSGRRVVIIEGYFFRTSGSKVRAHALAIKEYFKPLKRHEARAAAVVRQARIGADVLVGVHLRQFDPIIDHIPHPVYRYQNADQTTGPMRHTADLFPGKKVAFLLVSNNPVDPGRFPGFSAAQSTGHIAEDLHALSLCDYILASTYSTYSRWASFYGQVPLYQIENPGDVFALEDFRVHTPGVNDPTNESGPVEG